jgi:hypothetical protein
MIRTIDVETGGQAFVPHVAIWQRLSPSRCFFWGDELVKLGQAFDFFANDPPEATFDFQGSTSG